MDKHHLALEAQIEGFQLSPQQRHLWTLLQGKWDHPYCIQSRVSIEGPLQRAALEAAVQQVVARHEILRTTFQQVGGMSLPVQVIHDSGPVPIHYQDLSDQDTQHQKEQIAVLSLACRRDSLFLDQGP